MTVEASTRITAFLDRSDTPPPPPFLLTAQTNLFYVVPPPPTVLAQESIQNMSSSNPHRTLCRTNRRSNSPYVRPSGLTVRIATPSRNGDTDDSDDDSIEDVSTKIPKPSGEASRLNRGGYKLVDALDASGMSPAEIANLKKVVHALIAGNLKESISFKYQSPELLRAVCEAACAQLPMLDAYEDAWPVMDVIKSRLKSTSSSMRQKAKAIVNTSKAKEVAEAPESSRLRQSTRKVLKRS